VARKIFPPSSGAWSKQHSEFTESEKAMLSDLFSIAHTVSDDVDYLCAAFGRNLFQE